MNGSSLDLPVKNLNSKINCKPRDGAFIYTSYIEKGSYFSIFCITFTFTSCTYRLLNQIINSDDKRIYRIALWSEKSTYVFYPTLRGVQFDEVKFKLYEELATLRIS